MNAPAPIAAFSKPTLQLMQLDYLAPSSTHIQQLRRQRFTDEELKELADSIRVNGLVQHPLVRPIKAPAPISHEIVAGERRYLAAKLAGLTEIYVSVRELDDNQVLELQLIENLQRKGLHELEEAEGYEELMRLRQVNADAVGDMVGKSRSYVYARTKLLALCPEARKDFYAGTMNASEALLIARIPAHQVQREAMKDLAQAKDNGDVANFKEAQGFIREHYMLELKSAPFKLEDASLVPAAGTCTACPKRTGNQPGLFPEVKSADICTDTQCFDAKRAAFNLIRRKELEARGETVITGKEARKILPDEYSIEDGYVDPDRETWFGDNHKSWRKALGKDLPAGVMVEDPHTGKLRALVKLAELEKAAKAKGVKIGYTGSGSRGSSDTQKAKERTARIETMARMRILNAIRAASVDRQFGEADLRLIVQDYLGRIGFDSLKVLVDARNLAAGVPKPKGTAYVNAFSDVIEQMPLHELAPLMLDAALAGEVKCHAYYSTGKPEDLHATAERLGVDHEKIRAEVKAEFKEKAAAKGKKK